MQCKIKIDTSGFAIAAGAWRRAWKFTPQGAQTAAVRAGAAWAPALAAAPDLSECYYQGLLRQDLHRPQPFYPELRLRGEAAARPAPAALGEGACQVVTAAWTEPRQGVELVREWRVYPGTSAVAAAAAIRSDSAPLVEFGRADYLNVVDALPLDLRGWTVSTVSFRGRTDYTNELVRHEQRVIRDGAAPCCLAGNLLFLDPPAGDYGIFMLHELPPSDEVRPECAGAFRVGPDGAQALGWGLGPADILPDRLRWSHTVATGCYACGMLGRMRALRVYLHARYPAPPGRPTMVANPWGDGRCYRNLNEPFILRELEACAEMGLDCYQVDDGWQAGGMLRDISIDNLAPPPGYWKIHPEKFPRGFGPLVDQARAVGVQLSLWFAPDVNRHYRNWREQAGMLLECHRQYGINLFKIDAIKLRTRSAAEDLAALLQGVMAGSNGRVRFNMDVTNGRRLGYFASLRFGDVFVENRYVRPGRAAAANTYVPWRVLRNLWRLARYLPPERLQCEFPNRHRDCFADPAALAEAFEMRECRDDYLAAIPLMAAPLCWGEPSAFPPAARAEIARVLALHRRLRRELPGAHIFPAGAEPDGHAWTGFQACDPADAQRGWLLVFREDTASDTGAVQVWDWPAPARLECLSHREPWRATRSSGEIELKIPRPNDFRLYRYGRWNCD